MKQSTHPYASVSYLSSLNCEILEVPEWGTPVMIRHIPDTNLIDAAGSYPLAALRHDADFSGGFERLRARGAISIVLVPDPLSGPREEQLADNFPVFRQFKTHYLRDRRRADPVLSDNHRRNVVKARARCDISIMELGCALQDWGDLYSELVRRRGVSGIADFPPSYFAALARRPDLTTCTASRNGRILAAALWLRHCDRLYYHLGAASREGYANAAMFGLFDFAFQHFSDISLFDLGGAAGGRDDIEGGLAKFKRGFANDARSSYICGAVLDQARYAALTGGRDNKDFFPEYRRLIE